MRLNFTGNVLHQVVEVLDPSVRDRRLDELLRQYHASRRNRILVFVLYKKEASRVEAMLAKRGWKVRACHPQSLRLRLCLP